MGRIRDTIHADLHLGRTLDLRRLPNGLDNFLDWDDRAKDVRAGGESDEPRFGSDEGNEFIDLQRD